MRNATQVLPAHDNLEELCKQFANFFGDKIQKIRFNLVEVRGKFSPVLEPECEHILTGNPRRDKKNYDQFCIKVMWAWWYTNMVIKWMFRHPIASNYQISEFVFVNWNYA